MRLCIPSERRNIKILVFLTSSANHRNANDFNVYLYKYYLCYKHY